VVVCCPEGRKEGKEKGRKVLAPLSWQGERLRGWRDTREDVREDVREERNLSTYLHHTLSVQYSVSNRDR